MTTTTSPAQTATHYACLTLAGRDDPYTQAIQEAAIILHRAGKGDYTYGGQTASGWSWWRSPDGETSVSVTAEGKVRA